MSKNRQRSAPVNFPFPSAIFSAIEVLAGTVQLIDDRQRLGELLQDRFQPNQKRETRPGHFQPLVIEKALHAITITITITKREKEKFAVKTPGLLDR